MRILMTGTTGFIGSRLLETACEIYGVDNVIALSSRPNENCLNTIIYDRTDFHISEDDFSRLDSVEVIVHVGAFIPKAAIDANDLEGCNGSIDFTKKLLKLPFKSLKRVIYLSTVDVYTAVETISELTPTMPQTLYGHSKLYCEKMIAAYCEQKNVESLILRIGHVYGPGEEAYLKFLPKAIQRIVNDEYVELWGDGSELRSLIYIEDVIQGVLRAFELENYIDVINIVGGNPISIRELLNLLIKISGKSVEVNMHEFKGVKRDLVFDNTRFKKYLEVQETSLLEGLTLEYNHMKNLK